MTESFASERFGAFRELEERLQRDGQRLADLEYRNLTSEIMIESRVRIKPAANLAGPDVSIQTSEDKGSRLLEYEMLNYPPLNVPLGRIAFHKSPADLPVIGIHIPECDEPALVVSLMALLGEHHRAPFGRLLFLISDLAIVPFLGRYGMACFHVGPSVGPDDFRLLEVTFGLKQVRTLLTGERVWPPESVPE